MSSPAVAAALALALAARLPADDLAARREISIDGVTFARFLQQHRGVPVLDAGIAIVVAPSGAIVHVGSRLLSDFPVALPSLDATRAARLLGSSWDGARASLVFIALPTGTHLAWRLRAIVPQWLPTRPVALVDAHDGTLLRVDDDAHDAGFTLAYDVNPIATPKLGKVAVALLPAGAKTLSSPELDARSCVDRGRVKTFSGKDVHVCDVESMAVADASGDFLISPPEDPSVASAFGETQAFFHAAKIVRYVRDELGVDVLPTGSPLPLVTNLRWPPGWTAGDATKIACGSCPLEPIPNAFFAAGEAGGPGTVESLFETRGDAIWFGLGPRRSWAVDGSVVYHEFTHAIVQATIRFASSPRLDEQGVSFAPGAMNEGIADYFASALAGSPRLGEWVAADLDPPRDVLRDLGVDARCPAQLVGEVHYDSLMLSSALHRVRAGLADEAARRTLDRAVLATLAAGHSGDLAFEEFAALMVETTHEVASKALADVLASELGRHGLLPPCERVVDLVDANPAHAASSFGWIAPGRAVVGVKGSVPPVIQFRRALPPGATRAVIRLVRPKPFHKTIDLAPPSGQPFAPRLVVSVAGPIRYLPNGSRTPGSFEVPLSLEPTGDAFHGELALDTVGEGAHVLQVAIESDGDVDGNYDLVSIATDGGQPARADPTVGGGGCTFGGGPGSMDTAWMALLALATSRAFRSRRSRR